MARLKLLFGLQFPDGTTQDTASSGGGGAASTVALPFTGETLRRFTVIDVTVGTSSHIDGSIRRPDIAEAADFGWVYHFNVVTLSTGSFDVLVSAMDEDGPAIGPGPTETVTLVYKVWS